METISRNKKFYEKYSLQKYYRDYFKQSINYYTSYTSNFELNIATEIIDETDFKILIVGLGFGRELDHFLKYFEKARVSVVDFNSLFIDNAKAMYNSDRVDFFQVDLNEDRLPFSENSFDYILCLNTLEYLNQVGYHNFFKQASLILTAKGALVFRHLNKSFPFSFLDIKHQKQRDISLPRLEFREYSEMLRELNSGFQIYKEVPYNFQISIRFLKSLYSNSFLSIGLFLEGALRIFFAPKHFKNIYIIAKKKANSSNAV